MKMKKFFISVSAGFLILFNSCNSTDVRRHDYSSSVKENALLKIKKSYFSGGNVVVDGKRIDADYVNVDYLIPAGRHDIYSRISVAVDDSERDSEGQYRRIYTYTYGGKNYTSRDRLKANVQGSFEFEQGKYYEFTTEWINVTPVGGSGIFYTDKDDNLYQGDFKIDEYGLYHFAHDTILPYFRPATTSSANVTYRLWRIVIKEIKDRKLGNAYIVTDSGPIIGVGIRYPNSLSGEFSPTFGFALYSGKIDMTVYAKAGFGVGFGVRDYNFNDFNNNALVSVAFPLGVNMDLYNGKLGIGIGGGCLFGYNMSFGGEFSGFESTPYLQLKFGKPHEGSFYIDYYPSVTPVYSGFGAGVLWRW